MNRLEHLNDLTARFEMIKRAAQAERAALLRQADALTKAFDLPPTGRRKPYRMTPARKAAIARMVERARSPEARAAMSQRMREHWRRSK